MITILFIGDIVGEDGLHLAVDLIPRIRRDFSIDFIIANGENIDHGKGLTTGSITMLREAHIDVITSGNHIWENRKDKQILETYPWVLRPYNYPAENYGSGIIHTASNNAVPITVINMQGRGFMAPIDCPFQAIDKIIPNSKKVSEIIIIDMHAESTAEKQAFAWYLDGRVSAVIGTHTHVQTADERILPNGTGYITDVGMTGPFDSVIGMRKEVAIRRFRYQTPSPYQLASGDLRLNGVVLKIDDKTFITRQIKRLNFSKMEYNGIKTN
jgi:metallophosphoesterase (TIGR00282 family)